MSGSVGATVIPNPDGGETGVRNATPDTSRRSVMVTGAAGYIGRQVVEALSREPGRFSTVVAADIREVSGSRQLPGVVHAVADVRDEAVRTLMEEYRVDTVVHLAAIVTPRRGDTREFQYEVDVGGTRNVLEAAVACGVRKFIYTSSGAAYGYSPENPPLLHEDDPLRGNETFAYAWHKRLVEEMLAEYRKEHPELSQVVFRVSTILGPSVNNQITAHFERAVVVGIAGVASPFCFVSDRDVVGAILSAIHGDRSGVYNLAGDGVMTLREIALGLGRRYGSVREDRLRKAFAALKRLGISTYGEEQLLFLRYRPVLSARRLRTEFGYRPRLSTRQVFETYRRSRVRPEPGEVSPRIPGPSRPAATLPVEHRADVAPVQEELEPLLGPEGLVPEALPIPEPV